MIVDEPAYLELRATLDRTSAAIAERRAPDLACRKGCTACCHVELTLSPVEAARVRLFLAALPAQRRTELRARASTPPTAGGPCAMLDADGGCAIYAERPLVCRTQGNALRYPADVLPAETVFARAQGGDITWCPLNYRERSPRSEDVLEASLIDELLAQANLAAARGDTERALERTSLRHLAAE